MVARAKRRSAARRWRPRSRYRPLNTGCHCWTPLPAISFSQRAKRVQARCSGVQAILTRASRSCRMICPQWVEGRSPETLKRPGSSRGGHKPCGSQRPSGAIDRCAQGFCGEAEVGGRLLPPGRKPDAGWRHRAACCTISSKIATSRKPSVAPVRGAAPVVTQWWKWRHSRRNDSS